MRRHHRRRGYVLVVTLGLLVLAVTLMVSIGRASLRRAAAAREAAEDLQRRWGATSCRLAVMPAIESVLVDQERKVRRPVALHRARLRLGEQTFDVVLADEQAKANVNLLLEESDSANAETRMREAMTGTGIGHLIRLRPDPAIVSTVRAAGGGGGGGGGGGRGNASTAPATQPLLPQRVSGFGQVFDDVPPAQLIGASQWVTCWGNGLVNVRRAPQSAMKLATPLSGVEIAALLRLREGSTSGGLLKSANIKPRAGLHLTESSTCHSLWIVARSNRREWHYFTVLDATEQSSPGIVSFVW
jgi:hypothetical protein